jgi:hypothetical protein
LTTPGIASCSASLPASHFHYCRAHSNENRLLLKTAENYVKIMSTISKKMERKCIMLGR